MPSTAIRRLAALVAGSILTAASQASAQLAPVPADSDASTASTTAASPAPSVALAPSAAPDPIAPIAIVAPAEPVVTPRPAIDLERAPSYGRRRPGRGPRPEGMIVGGIVAIVVAHGVMIPAAVSTGAPIALIPIAGPFIYGVDLMTSTASCTGGGLCSIAVIFGAILGTLSILDGLAQAGGTVLLSIGLTQQARLTNRTLSRRGVFQWAVIPGAPDATFGATLLVTTF